VQIAMALLKAQPKSAIPAAEFFLKTAPFTVQIGRFSGGFQ
jgi:hypothetical protein